MVKYFSQIKTWVLEMYLILLKIICRSLFLYKKSSVKLFLVEKRFIKRRTLTNSDLKFLRFALFNTCTEVVYLGG